MTETDHPLLRQRLSFRRETAAEGEEVLYVETRVQPGGGVTPHVHPALEERFRILSGNPTFLAGRKWKRVPAGETVVVPPGVRHAYRNDTDEEVHFVCEARPASTLQEFLEDATELARTGKLTRLGLPKSFDALLRAAVMVERYRDMVVLGFPPLPPVFVQRLLFPPLARLGERRGYGAGRLTASAGVGIPPGTDQRP
jgi:quercetin dioxygenase-like cupin family protein